MLRNYSLSGPPGRRLLPHHRQARARRRRQRLSAQRLAVGDQLDIAAPRGTFILDRSDAPVLLISAGIGATPVLAMLHALAHEHAEREVWWLHGARSSRDHAVRRGGPGAPRLAAERPNPRLLQPPRSERRRRPRLRRRRSPHRSGARRARAAAATPRRTSAARHRSWRTSAPGSRRSASVPRASTPSRSGPASGLTPGIAATPTRTPHPPAGKPGNGPTIEFARSNLAVPWSSDYASLLELAEACDVPVRWSCRTGVCHNCETTLIAGNVDYDPEPVEPPADGSALICCSQPRDGVVLDL